MKPAIPGVTSEVGRVSAPDERRATVACFPRPSLRPPFFAQFRFAFVLFCFLAVRIADETERAGNLVFPTNDRPTGPQKRKKIKRSRRDL